MECFFPTVKEYQKELFESCTSLPCPVEQVCFFDIETTGLSPDISSLYLLGAAFVENGTWRFIQWYADDYVSEAGILDAFSSFLAPFETVAHYNGSTFDIPYLEKKYLFHHLDSPFQGKRSLDLYRCFPLNKKLLPLPNRKLITVERSLGFQRHDTFTGKDCIKLYTDFMHLKFFRNDSANRRKADLLLHNHDDLIGTIFCSRLLCYENYQPKQPHWRTEKNTLVLCDQLDRPVPLPLTYQKGNVQITMEHDLLTVQIPLYDGTLYHYFKDYKNYFYLPKEDMAVHKSVGIYVEEDFREKATAANCYIKRSGFFLPVPNDMETDQPLFQETRRSRTIYVPWTETSTLSDKQCQMYLTALMHTQR